MCLYLLTKEFHFYLTTVVVKLTTRLTVFYAFCKNDFCENEYKNFSRLLTHGYIELRS